MQEYAADSSTRQCVNDVNRVSVGRVCVTPASQCAVRGHCFWLVPTHSHSGAHLLQCPLVSCRIPATTRHERRQVQSAIESESTRRAEAAGGWCHCPCRS